MICKCGHEAWEHHAINDPERSGLLGRCVKKACECEQFARADDEGGMKAPKPGDTVTVVGDVGGYCSNDPERWADKFDVIVDKGSEGIVVGEHPTMPGWWIVKVVNEHTGNYWVPLVLDHFRDAE